jgi:hypothetical protein
VLSGLPNGSSIPPGTLLSDIDQKTFCPDWTLRLGWKVSFVGASTKRGREHNITHRKTGGSFLDVDINRRRDYWAQMTEAMRQEALASKLAPNMGDGDGFPW